MSRIAMVDAVQSAPTFSHSIKSMKEMAAKRRLGLFSVASSLTDVQKNYLFDRLKAHVKDLLASNAEIQREFQYQLMMSTPDANTFLNVLAGWRSSASKAHELLLDTCIRDVKTLYPEIYKFIDAQAPIYKPA
jgi:hypothetical protein